MKARLLSAVGRKTRYAPRGASVEAVELERVENQRSRSSETTVRWSDHRPSPRPIILDYPPKARTDEKDKREEKSPGRDINDPGLGKRANGRTHNTHVQRKGNKGGAGSLGINDQDDQYPTRSRSPEQPTCPWLPSAPRCPPPSLRQAPSSPHCLPRDILGSNLRPICRIS